MNVPDAEVIAKHQNDIGWLGKRTAKAQTRQDVDAPEQRDLQTTSILCGAGHDANLPLKQESSIFPEVFVRHC
jgi:hypothetical protein